MSATAFQRMRREAAIKAAQTIKDNKVEEPDNPGEGEGMQIPPDKQEDNEKDQMPQDNPEENDGKALSEMDVEELKEYAEKNNIDIGKATSASGILAKIKEAEKSE